MEGQLLVARTGGRGLRVRQPRRGGRAQGRHQGRHDGRQLQGAGGCRTGRLGAQVRSLGAVVHPGHPSGAGGAGHVQPRQGDGRLGAVPDGRPSREHRVAGAAVLQERRGGGARRQGAEPDRHGAAAADTHSGVGDGPSAAAGGYGCGRAIGVSGLQRPCDAANGQTHVRHQPSDRHALATTVLVTMPHFYSS